MCTRTVFRDLWGVVRDEVAQLRRLPVDADTLARIFQHLRPWSFSRDFLARIPGHLVVARADDLGWGDWGTPEAVERTFETLGIVPPWRMRGQSPTI